MRVDIGGGVRLYVDVDGMGLVPVAGKLVQRPTLVLLHGGPGFDHATYKLGMHEMRDVAQVVMYDHRGHGRSDRGTPAEWTLDTWADDVVRLCDALEIEKPIVLGNSFGGFVAQRYLGRHPDHAAKVVLSSTAPRWDLEAVLAMFRSLGGDEAYDTGRGRSGRDRPRRTARRTSQCAARCTRRRPATCSRRSRPSTPPT